MVIARDDRRGLARLVARLAFSALGALWMLFSAMSTKGEDQCSDSESPTVVVDASNSASSTLADCRLSLLARQALFADKALANLPLGVAVRANVASLWGRAPTLDLARLAEQHLREVPGVAAVRNEIRVESTPREEPITSLATPLGPHRSGVLQATVADTVREPLICQLVDDASTVAAGPAHDSVHYGMNAQAKVMPQIVISSGKEGARAARSVSLLRPVAPSADAALASAVDQLKASYSALGGVRADIHGGIIHLSGAVAAWDDLLRFAQAVSRIPGVERVILDAVNTSAFHHLSIP